MSLAAASLSLPSYSGWQDDQLNGIESHDFVEMLHRRSLAVGNDVYDPAAYELVDIEPHLYAERVVFYLRRRAWAEWYFGTVTPARQIVLLPDDWVGLKLRLARQIVDEVRHHDVFCQLIRRRGGKPDLSKFPAPPALLQMREAQLATEFAAELAVANQYSGEVVLEVTSRVEDNVLRRVLADDIMHAIENIEADEPSHIAVGRDLVLKHIDTADQRRRMASAQERFLLALIIQHSNEIQMLGSRRIRPLPAFAE
jgi:hypothetical protein